MTLSAVKNGGWSTQDILTSAEITGLQSELLKAVDSNGGSYTNSALISFTGNLQSNGFTCATLTVAGDASVGDDLSVTDNAAFGGGIDVGTYCTIGGDFTTGEGTHYIGGTLTCANTVTNGTATFNDVTTITDLLTFSGQGRPKFKTVTGANANATYYTSTATVVVTPDSINANRTYKIGAGGTAGEIMIFAAGNAASGAYAQVAGDTGVVVNGPTVQVRQASGGSYYSVAIYLCIADNIWSLAAGTIIA